MEWQLPATLRQHMSVITPSPKDTKYESWRQEQGRGVQLSLSSTSLRTSIANYCPLSNILSWRYLLPFANESSKSLAKPTLVSSKTSRSRSWTKISQSTKKSNLALLYSSKSSTICRMTRSSGTSRPNYTIDMLQSIPKIMRKRHSLSKPTRLYRSALIFIINSNGQTNLPRAWWIG